MIQPARTVALRARTVAGTTIHNLAAQDVIALAFHLCMWFRALAAPDSPGATIARASTVFFLLVTIAAFAVSRGEILPSRRARSLVYRLGIFLPIFLSYFQGMVLLPALQADLYDLRLLAIDELLVGTTPAVWLAQFNYRPLIEWVAFFYYCYFYVLAGMILPALFSDSGRRMQEILAGSLLVATVGHVVYTIVPGLGPYATLVFDEPLNGGFWWRQVEAAVAAAGAQLDIFPSLHTAYPVFFALLAYRHRHDRVFRYLWPIIAFIALNIVAATMVLRWHWLIDVLAGLLLAFAALRFAIFVGDREQYRGTRLDDRQPVWEDLWR